MGGTFSADLSRFCKKYDADIKLVIRKITFEAFKRVILRTPVDTGRARASWGVAEGKPVSFEIVGEDKSGTATLSAAQNGVMSWQCQGSLFMTSSLKYMPILEFGREDGRPGSRQAPSGMVRVTMEEMVDWIKRMSVK